MVCKLLDRREGFSCVARYFYSNNGFVFFESVTRILIVGAGVASFKSFNFSKSVFASGPIVRAYSQMQLDNMAVFK